MAPRPGNPRAALLQQRIAVWNATHPHQQIDPQADLAVAGTEGLSGGIGDGGHAFGPHQANDAGGVLTGKLQGLTPEQKNAWAWSPQGIDFQLAGIAKAAGGLRGEAAVRAIVSNYERPANPTGEIARALAGLGGAGMSAASSAVPAAAGAPAPLPQPVDRTRQLLAALGGAGGDNYAGFYKQLGGALRARNTPAPQPQAATVGPQASTGGPQAYAGALGQILGNTQGENAGFLQKLAQLAGYQHAPIQINSGYRSTQKQAQLYANRGSNPNPVAPPGHSLHEQGLAADGTIGGKPIGTLPAALLARFGLMSVPGDPVHVQVRR